MKAPKTVTTETVYYTLVVFYPGKNRGETLETVYKTRDAARNRAKAILENATPATEILMRRETVSYRDADNEISDSMLIEKLFIDKIGTKNAIMVREYANKYYI